MKSRNFVPKAKQLADFKLDFAEADEDQNFKEIVEEFRNKARELSLDTSKRSFG